ncbi:unnamed protein product [Peronospora farinosa]|uniref:Hyaluronan/mRNA-binding protein domain-containing protein n=1 Tax=Peronospora farinosa TaxID=134698 RepID=A0AAV0U4L1_9STRA|nr:unnamed protein product [Peronospora farinosa]
MREQASKYQNIFAALDSDEEDAPRVNKKATLPTSTPVTLNKPAAGNKKSGNKMSFTGDKKDQRGPREGGRGPREGGRGPREGGRGPRERGDRSGRDGQGRGSRGFRRDRDQERHSGTGRGKEAIKQGGGAHNWGNKADPNEQMAEAAVQEGAKPVSDEEAGAEDAVPEEEEEKKKRSAVQITKEGKTPDFIDSQYEKVYSKKTSGRKKQLITDVGFRLEKPERFTRDMESSRGGRGGRGGRSTRGNGRTGGRSGRGANAPNVTDMSAFPSLG